MRQIPYSVEQKLKQRVLAKSTSSELSLSLWVNRPTVPLTEDRWLEKQTILSGNVSEVSTAVNHPYHDRAATRVYIAYIEDGVAKVQTAAYKEKMQNHIWKSTNFSEWAEDVSICFDGTMPKTVQGDVQFITEEDPWVFWVLNGQLLGRKLHGAEEDTITLAESNCTKVSAVRAVWSQPGSFDFGLIVFFLLGGQLHYRQLIDGEWMDGEVVLFGPENATWVDIAASRTWDYRIAIQCMDASGEIYELFSQYQGFGKQTTENITITDIRAQGDLIPIKYHARSVNEHIHLTNITADGKLIWGLNCLPVEAHNISDGADNWGYYIVLTMDHEILHAEDNATLFTIQDSKGTVYGINEIIPSEGGLVLTFKMEDFNLAEIAEYMTITYTKPETGGVLCPAGDQLESFTIDFVPKNLVAPDIPVPVPIEVVNI